MLTFEKCSAMTDDDNEPQRLGDYLREQRQAAGLTAAEFCQQTKIAPTVLRAMESGDYRALPAHAFARGFYGIYAKTLGLNGERIATWYNQEWQQIGDAADNIGVSAISSAPETHRMASAKRARPLMTLLILLAILALIITTICWRFEINPATVIREKIHLVQMRSQNRPRYFRVPTTGKVIRRTDTKKKTPLVTLSGEH